MADSYIANLSEVHKIDSLAVDGLNGTYNSMSYKVHENERHLHSYSCWFEEATTPSGEDHIADRLGEGNGASFMIDAGNDDWGTWVQIIGATDTPQLAGSAYFDLHQILITAAETAAIYYVQIAFGASGAAAYTAGTYTEFPILTTNPLGKSIVQKVQSRRHAAGTKVWVRCKAEGENTATMHFRVGIHEYEG
jgi:hypothetical protein